MLDQNKPVIDCTAQELVAALMLQAVCDAFDPAQVLRELYENSELWKSFWMGSLLPLDDGPLDPLVFIFLRDLDQFWHATTLYVLTNDKSCIASLRKLGFHWNCDTIRVISGTQAKRLLGNFEDDCHIVMYWWD